METNAPAILAPISKNYFFQWQDCRSRGGRGGHCLPLPPQILMDQLTRSQPGGIYYAHKIATRTSGFLDLPTAPNETGYFQTGKPRADILQ